jgi:hypothetical protein
MPTEQPFTVIVCSGCPTEFGQTPPVEVLDAVGSAVRECRHGVVISVPCLLGPPFCTGRPGGGVLAAVQACTVDRRAVGPAHIVGPIRRRTEMTHLCEWLRSGQWTRRPRPFFGHMPRSEES